MSLVLIPSQASPSKPRVQQRVTEPRPPVPGSESSDTGDERREARHDMGHERQLRPAPSPWSGKPVTMAPSPQAGSEAGSVNRGFEPEGSADVTPPFSESNSANSGPAYLKWAENLHNLLSDPDGVELYKTYMKNENVGELLDFWFACEGLKRLPYDQNEKIYQIIKVINKKFLRSRLVPIGEETRKVISDKIGAKSGTDQTIFDTAQCEVEERMTRTTYRNFLASDMYLAYIQSAQQGSSSEPGLSPKLAGSGSQSAESSLSGAPGDSRPGQDDSGHFSQPPTSSLGDLDRTRSSQSTRAASSALSTITSDSTSGVSESSSSVNINSSLIAPAVPNTSVNTCLAPAPADLGSEEPVSMSHYSMSHSATLPTLHENSELDLEPGATGQAPSLPASLMSSLTQANISLSARKRHQIKPESQAGMYLHERGGPGGGGRVPHPYHAYNSAYNPVSRQDSEIQSLSSDAHTTDDNMSSFTESNSSHYSNHYRLQHNKKYLRRQARKIQEQSRQNRENYLPQNSSFIPRTERIPFEASRQPSPAEFAEILIKKLEKVKREQELDEKLNKKLAEDAQSMVSQGSNRSLADILREKLIVTDDLDGDQSILDDHVSRIWTDKTPLRSPGDPSGRPRSPGFGGRQRGQSGASRSTMGPPGARRSVPTGQTGLQRGAQPRYNQDLAYYDLGPGAGPVIPGSGVNQRVREWMLDVERHSVELDQRSHSSKANIKKSGHGGHRAASQERVMSTSWQGPAYGPGSLSSEADKRRLGSSLAMPPPSQANTLRRTAPGPATVPEVTIAVYTFSHEKGEPMPYRIKIPSKKVTLRHVKDFLPKKGAFRFYFKTEVDGDMCYEEETEDGHPVPLWEGKILVQCRLVD